MALNFLICSQQYGETNLTAIFIIVLMYISINFRWNLPENFSVLIFARDMTEHKQAENLGIALNSTYRLAGVMVRLLETVLHINEIDCGALVSR
ncbi:MAG: hypothetical protein DRR19_01505 [Candidatus Parabeggiatoa sp. nov. 1]|nr:MAG: hypothetical protein DRR19_01505 [Gammaproteobacteria bacterium]